VTFLRCVNGAVIASLLCTASPPPLMAQSQESASGVEQPSATPAGADGATYQSAIYTPQDKDERGLWMEVDEQERKLKNSNFVIHDPALNAYVHDVFCRTVGPDCNALRLYIVRTPYFNATTAPNGMIQVWSGLFLRTRDEAQLAAVLAHEYVHYRDHHFIKLWRDLKSKSGAAAFFGVFGIIGGLIALAQLSSVFSFSRDMEASADAGSVELLVKAGYDPMAASRVWEQIRAEADATAAARNVASRKDKTGGMFATHPPTAERMAMLKALVAKVPTTGPKMLRRAEYRAALGPLWAAFIDDQIKRNDFGGTEFLIGFLANEGWTSDLNYARGELYRSRGRPADMTAAVGFYRQATADQAAPVEAWRGLGLSLLRSGAQADGQAALKIYLARKPDASDKAMIAMLAGV